MFLHFSSFAPKDVKTKPLLEYTRTGGGQHGFALIVALTLMAFLVLLLMGLLAVVSVETQLTTSQQKFNEAKANALLGLQVALGQLQEYAGPDQRITATASLFDESPDAPDVTGVANPHWVGVWNGQYGRSASFNQSFDRGDSVLTWLVSGNERADSGSPELDAVTDTLSSDDNDTVFLATAGKTVESIADEIRVRKTPIEDRGAYAYWVSDEGIKGKISPDDARLIPGSALADQPMANRINLGSGLHPHIEFLNGLADFPGDYTQGQSILSGIGDLSLIDENYAVPGREYFHDLTTCSYGVLSDPARGGLKRDLSLAFEMDENTFLQTEFAGDYGRQNYGENFAVSFLFHEQVPGSGRKVRGPTWHLMRDFHRLYKQVDNAADNPSIATRATFPNVPEVYRLGVSSAKNEGPYWNYRNNDYLEEVDEDDKNIVLPNATKAQVMPVLNRLVYYFYMDVGLDPNNPGLGEDVRLIYNPAIFLWNPYNVAITFESVVLETQYLPMRLEYMVVRRDGPDDTSPTVNGPHILTVAEAMQGTLNEGFESFKRKSDGTRTVKGRTYITFIINKDGSSNSAPVTMEPGEIKVFSINDPTVVGFQEEIYAGEGWSVDGGAAISRIKPYENADGTEVRYDPVSLSENDSLDDIKLVPTDSHIALSLMDVKTLNDPHRVPLDIDLTSEHFRNKVPEAWGASIEFVDWDSAKTGELHEDGPFDYIIMQEEKQSIAAVDIFLKAAAEDQYPNEMFGFSNVRSLRQHFKNASISRGESYRWGFWGIRYHDISTPNGNFLQFDGASNRGFWGDGYSSSSQTHVVSFEVPTYPPVSLGMYQHLDISPSAYNPAYAIGNSLASPFFDRDTWIRVGSGQDRTTWDVSWLANRSLWDRYYLSSLAPEVDYGSSSYNELSDIEAVVASLAGDDERMLRNGRMKLYRETGTDLASQLLSSGSLDPQSYRALTGHLMVDGSFNVNSTSVEAWKSLLMSTSGAEVDTNQEGAGVSVEAVANDQAALGRFSLPGGEQGDNWKGFRALTEPEAQTLAELIVTEVKTRGPFLSLADFINRRLANDDTGLKGVLQAALDKTSINSSVEYDAVYKSNRMPNPENMGDDTGRGIAGYITQGDLLTPLAPQLAARSDTFIIRAYGEALSSITGKPVSAAWCEAVVQRFPDFVDGANAAHTPMDDAEAAMLGLNTLTEENRDFGRRFRIVSFRWLNEDEV